MIFTETRVRGVWVIEPERKADARGFFARTWCQAEFGKHGLNSNLAQCSISHNKRKGTIRGMHFQDKPWPEVKLIRCTMGAIYDVALDLRRDSPTFKQWVAEELSAENRRMLYVPQGCAHGFQTLKDNTEVYYQMSESYHPEAAGGVRWNDPAFSIAWPLADVVVSDRDDRFPDFHS